MTIQADEWISLIEAARRMGVTSPTALRILHRAGVRQLEYPGARARYHAADLAAVIEASVRLPANPTREPEHACA